MFNIQKVCETLQKQYLGVHYSTTLRKGSFLKELIPANRTFPKKSSWKWCCHVAMLPWHHIFMASNLFAAPFLRCSFLSFKCCNKFGPSFAQVFEGSPVQKAERVSWILGACWHRLQGQGLRKLFKCWMMEVSDQFVISRCCIRTLKSTFKSNKTMIWKSWSLGQKCISVSKIRLCLSGPL